MEGGVLSLSVMFHGNSSSYRSLVVGTTFHGYVMIWDAVGHSCVQRISVSPIDSVNNGLVCAPTFSLPPTQSPSLAVRNIQASDAPQVAVSQSAPTLSSQKSPPFPLISGNLVLWCGAAGKDRRVFAYKNGDSGLTTAAASASSVLVAKGELSESIAAACAEIFKEHSSKPRYNLLSHLLLAAAMGDFPMVR